MSGFAVSTAAVERTVGYSIEGADFSEDSGNLPQRLVVIGEMNTANQSASLTPVQGTSSQQIGLLYGFGSPLHIAARIYFPDNGGAGINGIPVWFSPQLAAVSSVANSQSITVTATPTANVTHTVLICGRTQLESGTYDINIVTTDTATTIAAKIAAAITAVLECPVSATSALGVVTTVAKWTGLTSQDITISVLTNGHAAGVSYAIAEVAAGSGTPSINASLTALGSAWNTAIQSCYGLVSSIITSLTNWNGNINSKTGQYAGIIMRPAIAFIGSVLDTTTSSADTVITDTQKAEMTISVGPAAMSLGLPMEAAANAAILALTTAQDNPNIDCQGQFYPDMPLPAAGSIPASASYTVRNALVKMGMSTALIVDGRYQIQSLITTYHPTGESKPAFMYVSALYKDMNIKYGWYNIQNVVILNKQIAKDSANVTATNVVKPKDVKAAIAKYALNLESRGLIEDAKFMTQNATVSIPTNNPDRFDIFWPYDRTNVVRVVSTQVKAGV